MTWDRGKKTTTHATEQETKQWNKEWTSVRHVILERDIFFFFQLFLLADWLANQFMLGPVSPGGRTADSRFGWIDESIGGLL